jgi:hypothetical protein
MNERSALAPTPPMGWNSWNIDDCWSVKSGRDSNGDLVADLWEQKDVADFGYSLIRRVQPHQTLLLEVSVA